MTSLCHYVRMSTDQADHLPLYAKLEQTLITRIADGSLSPGTRLPSEDSLVQEYALSRTTVRAAIQSLIQRGLVERTSYSIGHRPVDYEKLHYRRDRIRFATRLARRKPAVQKGRK